MTGPSDRPLAGEGDALDQLARAAAGGLSRRQVAKLGGTLALAALLPRWPAPARAARTRFALAPKTTGVCPPQQAGTCAGARLPWTPDCKHPVAKGNHSEFNGCGPQGGLDLKLLGHGDWVPDTPLDLANFFDACKGHDCCYGQCGSDKSACDTKFLKDMLNACVESPSVGQAASSLFGRLGVTTCMTVAAAYHAAVSDTQTGQDAYDAGQQEVCDCCKPTYLIKFDSTIDETPGDGGSGSWHFDYVAQLTVQPDATSGYYTGSTAGTYAAASGTMTGTDGTSVTVTGGTGDAFEVRLDIPTDPNDTTPPQLTLELNSPTEHYHADDPSTGYAYDYDDHTWLSVFERFHPPANGYVVLNLERGSGDLVAHGSWTNSNSGNGSLTETTTIDVYSTSPTR